MKRNITYILYLALFLGSFLLTGCAQGPHHGTYPILPTDNPQRLVVQGIVTGETSETLEEIRVDIYGVREENEGDILSYNYAITATNGHYTICRYLGRNLPTEVIIVASDPNGKYKDETLFVPQEDFALSGLNIEISADFSLTLLE